MLCSLECRYGTHALPHSPVHGVRRGGHAADRASGGGKEQTVAARRRAVGGRPKSIDRVAVALSLFLRLRKDGAQTSPEPPNHVDRQAGRQAGRLTGLSTSACITSAAERERERERAEAGALFRFVLHYTTHSLTPIPCSMLVVVARSLARVRST